ncbi:unnamed protein product [Bursaphelenchus okinawaensis]|uniref:Nuclear hormone receptor HR96 n=1 Tax=Bursaphelenchus okinawaensis TaxID=465554 RepID=A0A811KZD8_9BILA|nr:unnamed protein product [Bursaphelenchus okinawaensis]CAG9113410.1 unnamed protein product [Bursaphelenchus okinawaensis]
MNEVEDVCKICGDKPIGFNFGVITCDSCRSFFRRCNGAEKALKCPFQSNCVITKESRRCCQACRLQKCYIKGMVHDESSRKRTLKPPKEAKNKSLKIVKSEAFPQLKTEPLARSQARCLCKCQCRFYPPDTPLVAAVDVWSSYDASYYPSSTKQVSSLEDSSFFDPKILLSSGTRNLANNGASDLSLLRGNDYNSSITTRLPVITTATTEGATNDILQHQELPRSSKVDQKVSPATVLSPNLSPYPSITLPSPINVPTVTYSSPSKSSMSTTISSTLLSAPSLQASTSSTASAFKNQLPASELELSQFLNSSQILNSLRTMNSGTMGNGALNSSTTNQSQTNYPNDFDPNALLNINYANAIQNSPLLSTLPNFYANALQYQSSESSFQHLSPMPSTSFYDALETQNSNGTAVVLDEENQLLMDELLEANGILKTPMELQLQDIENPEELPLKTVVRISDLAMRRIISMVKQLKLFRRTSYEDKIALLKGGLSELLILRGLMVFDPRKNAWIHNIHSGSQLISLHVDVLKKTPEEEHYDAHIRFLTSFDDEWRRNEFVMLILNGILLFNPNRPNIRNKEQIQASRVMYINLLKCYLDGFCGANRSSEEAFNNLLAKLDDLTELNRSLQRIYQSLNPDDLDPLLKELFADNK